MFEAIEKNDRRFKCLYFLVENGSLQVTLFTQAGYLRSIML